MPGWTYIIVNESLPGLVKVGFTINSPRVRAQQLAHEGMPTAYQLVYAILSDDPRHLEQKAHRKLNRYSAGREWFRCSHDEAIIALKELHTGPLFDEEWALANRIALQRLLEQRTAARMKEILELAIHEECLTIAAEFDKKIRRVTHPSWGHFLKNWHGLPDHPTLLQLKAEALQLVPRSIRGCTSCGQPNRLPKDGSAAIYAKCGHDLPS